MQKAKPIHIDVEIDGLTNSIENVISGDSFQTEVLPLRDYDLPYITKQNDWQFNWKKEFLTNKNEIYKLTISGNPSIIQGIISVSDEKDHYFVHLIESAPFNVGVKKLYIGVPGNLFAFACKISKVKGYDGFVAFTSKTLLKQHYTKTIGAIAIGNSNKMMIYSDAANDLINRYF